MSNPFAKPDRTVRLDGLSVMIGMPTHRDLPPQTVTSLWATLERCHKLSIPCELGMVIAGSPVDGRDDVVDSFMASKANRLFWIDSDMAWTPDQFVRLLALSKLTPVVGATYPAKTSIPTFYVNYDKAEGLQQNEFGLLDVKGMGLGFTVVQREVIEQLVAKAPPVRNGVSGRTLASVFRWSVLDGERQGEDMAFFADIRELGYRVMLDPLTDLGHIGPKTYTGSIRDALQRIR